MVVMVMVVMVMVVIVVVVIVIVVVIVVIVLVYSRELVCTCVLLHLDEFIVTVPGVERVGTFTKVVHYIGGVEVRNPHTVMPRYVQRVVWKVRLG